MSIITRTNGSWTWSRLERFGTHMQKHAEESHCIYEWLMSQIQTSHITHRNGSRTWSRLEGFGSAANYHCYRRSWEISHITHAIQSCCMYQWVMSRIRISHVTRTNESCHIYEWVMSHVRMSHITHTNVSCHTYEWVMSHIRMSHVTYTIGPTTTRNSTVTVYLFLFNLRN